MSVKKIVLAALFAALTAVGAFIRIPMPPVPVTLQTFFAMLAALVAPPLTATLAMAAYLIIGLAGLPIFTTGGGPAALLGPTGGFLLALVPAVLVASIIAHIPGKSRLLFNIIALLAANVIIYGIGVPWLKNSLDLTWEAAFAAGCAPFLIGDTVKVVIALLLASRFRGRIDEMLR